MKALSLLLSVTLLTQSMSICFADVTSSAQGERYFIKVSRTTEGEISDGSRIKFEICEIADATKCDSIGSRDYSIRELRETREKLLQQSQSEAASGSAEIIGAILGALGGAAIGVLSGAAITGAIAPSGGAGLTALSIVGMGALGGAAIVGTLGGILIYKWIRHHKQKKAQALQKKAELLDDSVIEGQATKVSFEISDFAKDLGEVLSAIPLSDTAPAQANSAPTSALP